MTTGALSSRPTIPVLIYPAHYWRRPPLMPLSCESPKVGLADNLLYPPHLTVFEPDFDTVWMGGGFGKEVFHNPFR